MILRRIGCHIPLFAPHPTAKEGVNFRFVNQDVRNLQEIEPTDLLFIDTWHVCEQLEMELRHAPSVRKYIVLHDTETYGVRGETAGHEGLWPAVAGFLKGNRGWRIAQVFQNNNGVTVLERWHIV